ncbi:DUF397 domain-containing protein [Streptomyces sp. NPDC050560]|uniref:DUF397 domain-containing protein n=1 Tax=Streptomyces sp. NPDC050560 TaxID=3365630 RepID=UPI0037AD9848
MGVPPGRRLGERRAPARDCGKAPSYSSAQGDNCVEVAVSNRIVHIRDSKAPSRPTLAVGRTGWARFVAHASDD